MEADQGLFPVRVLRGHAVAFASHAQGTAYLLRHYPAEFLAAILSWTLRLLACCDCNGGGEPAWCPCAWALPEPIGGA